MRRVLVDLARARRTEKRGGDLVRVTFDEALTTGRPPGEDLVRLDDAMQAMATFDPRKRKVVELRFFGRVPPSTRRRWRCRSRRKRSSAIGNLRRPGCNWKRGPRLTMILRDGSRLSRSSTMRASKPRGAATRGFPQRVRETKHCGAKSSRCCVIRERFSRTGLLPRRLGWSGREAPGQHEGRTFGPYLLGSLVGAGGMGEVYRAHDSRLGRDVAVKVLSDSILHDPARTTRSNAKRECLPR